MMNSIKLKEKKGSGLLLPLNFNLEMDNDIKKALQVINPSVKFPDLQVWRKQVADYGALIAQTGTPYDAEVKISDQWISVNSGKNKIRLRIYKPLADRENKPVLLWMHGGGLAASLALLVKKRGGTWFRLACAKLCNDIRFTGKTDSCTQTCI